MLGQKSTGISEYEAMVMGVVRVLFSFVFWWFGFGFLSVFLVVWFLAANYLF